MTTVTPSLTLRRCVEVVVRTKIQCRDDPELRDMSITDGPAAEEVEGIKQNLVLGCAIPQTVLMLKEVNEPRLLSLISVCTEGQPILLHPQAGAPPFMRRLATSWYINVMGRDDGLEGAVLLDGETHLGAVTIRAAIEYGIKLTGSEPEIYASVLKRNRRARRALKALGFYRHKGSDKIEGSDVMVRAAGLPLPSAPPVAAYKPLVLGPEHEFPLAA